MSDAAEDAWFVLGCLGWAPPSEQPPDQATALRVVTEDGDIVKYCAVRAPTQRRKTCPRART